jgi:tetratricopeptide (TPR) repeat protein
MMHVLAVALPLLTAEPSTIQALRNAERLLEAGSFEQAIRIVQKALQDPELGEAARVHAYKLLGLAQLYLGREADARRSYEKLLELRPDYELPTTAPPKIQALYARIKEEAGKRRLEPVTLTAKPLSDVVGDQPLQVTVEIHNMAPGLKAKLYYRRQGTPWYSAVDFVSQDAAPSLHDATVPAYDLKAEDTPYVVQYYFDVSDAAQRRIAGRGTQDEPLSMRVLPPGNVSVRPQRRWYQNPWVWLAAGVVIAGATTGVVLIATQAR